jgi:cysteinyl-tRNA synthetase
MKIYNTYTNQLEEFKPIVENKVTMYVCGPTVNNYPHLGNLRPTVFFDVVARYLEFVGYDVTYASNFTDINPKITTAALEAGVTEREIADKFTAAYLKDARSLNCIPVDYTPTALGTLEELIEFIKQLIEKEYAYESNGNVYFRVGKVDDYGILSNQRKEDLESGSRVEVDENKENPLDFALWRKSEVGEVFESPWGKGIPGWHTECVVMIDSIFKTKIDIHGGGIDLKFPHHENEIAQSIACFNHKLANYWMHNGHINVDGIKMSKSLGNVFYVKDLIEKYSANVVRMLILKSHYRQPMDVTEKMINDVINTNSKISNSLKNANVYMQLNSMDANDPVMTKFKEYMDNDFNTPNVFTYLLELSKSINTGIKEKTNIGNEFSIMKKIVDLLGLKYDLVELSDDDRELYSKWNALREEKKFEEADEIRDKLVEKNIL